MEERCMEARPDECRKQAAYCELHAWATDDPNIKANMYYLAGLWRELADKKERAAQFH